MKIQIPTHWWIFSLFAGLALLPMALPDVVADDALDPLVSGPAPKATPSEPGWGFYAQYPKAWQAMHQSLLERAKKGNIDLIFIGDSITQGWNDAGKKVWDAQFAKLNAADFGIGGDSTRQVLWRLDHGEVDGLSPKIAVVMIGTNNLYGDNNAGTDEEIAGGITTVTKKIQDKLPHTKILLLGILPRQNDYFCDRIDKINAVISRLDDGKMIRYLTLKDSFLKSRGNVKTELYNADQLHLVEAGYQVWAEEMRPLLDEMMRDERQASLTNDLALWRAPTGGWLIVGDVALNPANPRKLKWADGKANLVNGIDGSTTNLLTRAEFGDVQAHVEFMISQKSNSGVYFMGRYELQIYDSFGVAKDEYPGIECGGIYPRWIDDHNIEGHSPAVNASLPPGQWQTFDVTFRAPRFDSSGRKIANAVFVKVIHNGKVIQENVEVTGPTRSAAFDDERPTGPIMLQGDHGPVAFRNITIHTP